MNLTDLYLTEILLPYFVNEAEEVVMPHSKIGKWEMSRDTVISALEGSVDPLTLLTEIYCEMTRKDANVIKRLLNLKIRPGQALVPKKHQQLDSHLSGPSEAPF